MNTSEVDRADGVGSAEQNGFGAMSTGLLVWSLGALGGVDTLKVDWTVKRVANYKAAGSSSGLGRPFTGI